MPKTYSFSGQITAPSPEEDPYYVAGTPVYVIVRADDGTELFNSIVTAFPFSQNYSNLSSPSGVVEMAYTNQNALDPSINEQKHLDRIITFTPEQ
jgi:hypothetical protein